MQPFGFADSVLGIWRSTVRRLCAKCGGGPVPKRRCKSWRQYCTDTALSATW
jgi:hypothetical protein